MAYYNERGERAPDVINVTVDGIVGVSFNPALNPQWREENGYTLTSPPPKPQQQEPDPEPVDSSAFKDACAKFREVCAAIGEAIGKPGFRGGFEEMLDFHQSDVFGTIEGLQLAAAWSGMNELCKYEGQKLGYGQPIWWRRCWELAEDAGGEPEPQGED